MKTRPSTEGIQLNVLRKIYRKNGNLEVVLEVVIVKAVQFYMDT